MPELVGQGLHGLSVVDVVADPHHPAGRVGVAVGAAAVPALQGVAVSGYLAGEVVPQPGRGLPGQQDRRDLGQRVALGLRDVETCTTRKPRTCCLPPAPWGAAPPLQLVAGSCPAGAARLAGSAASGR